MAVFYGDTQVAGGASCKFSEDSVRSACSSAVSSTLSARFDSVDSSAESIQSKIDTLSSMIDGLDTVGGFNTLDYGSAIMYVLETKKILSSSSFPFDAKVRTRIAAFQLSIDGQYLPHWELEAQQFSENNTSYTSWTAEVPAGVDFALSNTSNSKISTFVIPYRYAKKYTGDDFSSAPLSSIFRDSAMSEYFTAISAHSFKTTGYTPVGAVPWSSVDGGDWNEDLRQLSSNGTTIRSTMNLYVAMQCKKVCIVRFRATPVDNTSYSFPTYYYKILASLPENFSNINFFASFKPNTTIMIPENQYLLIRVTKTMVGNYHSYTTPNSVFSSVEAKAADLQFV